MKSYSEALMILKEYEKDNNDESYFLYTRALCYYVRVRRKELKIYFKNA